MKLFAVLAICAFAVCSAQDLVKVQYHKWSDPNPEGFNGGYSELEVPKRSTFGHVMDLAAEQNSLEYQLEYVEYPFGRYFTGIGGDREEPENKIHWMLYQVCKPDPKNPPGDDKLTEFGADGVLVNDGDCYLWWRKVVNYTSTEN